MVLGRPTVRLEVFQNHNNRAFIVVFCPLVRAEHFLVGDGPLESKKTAAKGIRTNSDCGVMVDPGGKLADSNGAKVNGITDEVKLGDN